MMAPLHERWALSRGHRLEKFPAPLQPPLRFVGGRIPRRKYHYVYKADGIRTAHFSPFLHDQDFNSNYMRMANAWLPGSTLDGACGCWSPLLNSVSICLGISLNSARGVVDAHI